MWWVRTAARLVERVPGCVDKQGPPLTTWDGLCAVSCKLPNIMALATRTGLKRSIDRGCNLVILARKHSST